MFDLDDYVEFMYSEAKERLSKLELLKNVEQGLFLRPSTSDDLLKMPGFRK